MSLKFFIQMDVIDVLIVKKYVIEFKQLIIASAMLIFEHHLFLVMLLHTSIIDNCERFHYC